MRLLLVLGMLVFSSLAIAWTESELTPSECGVTLTCIEVTYTPPVEYEDGEALTQIDRFNLYVTDSLSFQSDIQIPADRTGVTLVDVEKGAYYLQITTVSFGQEGEKSDPVPVSVGRSAPTKMGVLGIKVLNRSVTIEIVE